jgi:hypothetical protein
MLEVRGLGYCLGKLLRGVNRSSLSSRIFHTRVVLQSPGQYSIEPKSLKRQAEVNPRGKSYRYPWLQIAAFYFDPTC